MSTAVLLMPVPEKRAMTRVRQKQRLYPKHYRFQESAVLVASTGVIGAQLPMDKICAELKNSKEAWRSLEHGTLAAEAL